MRSQRPWTRPGTTSSPPHDALGRPFSRAAAQLAGNSSSGRSHVPLSTDTTYRPDTAAGPGGSVELSVGGMTCASCAARIEKKLNKLDGVTATVNFATEKARVSFPAAVSPDDLVAVVQQAGDRAALPRSPRMGARSEERVVGKEW